MKLVKVTLEALKLDSPEPGITSPQRLAWTKDMTTTKCTT